MGDGAGARPADAERLPVVVVGAGLAGLVCAVYLHEVGQPVVVLEASDGVGGRVRSDRDPDGFVLDRGFQVVLDGYPAARRWIDHPALRPFAFEAGAAIWTGKRLVPLRDPLRHPAGIPRDLTARVFPAADKLRLARFAAAAGRAEWQSAAEAATDPGPDVTAGEALWAQGFSRRFVDRFARPFWGGIGLDPTLRASAGPLRFTLMMLRRGRAVLPAEGIGMAAEQLSRRLPLDAVRLRRRVAALRRVGGAVRGVVANGEAVPAAAVVVAADPPAARRLTGVPALPDDGDGVGCVTVFLAGKRDPGIGSRLALDGTARLTINHLAPLSAVQPTYAPPGQHLVAAVVVGNRLGRSDDDLAGSARQETADLLGHDPADWRVLRVARVPFSQFAQPPGIYGRLPGNATGEPGLYLAGEATVDSSYNGAILSGEAAARAVLRDLARGGPTAGRGNGGMA